jgi:hypothetical protein
MEQFEPTVGTKKVIIENQLKGIYAQIYEVSISATVAKRIGNDKLVEAGQKNLELLEKTKNEYEKEYAQLTTNK